MKIATTLFIAIAGIVLLLAWRLKQTNQILKAEWLIGTWENKTSRGSIYETWNKKTAHEFSGMSYIIKEKDTVVFENIRLVQEQDSLFYIPAVKNQNDGLPVRFGAKTITGTRLVFENPKHDFPQFISYTKISSDSLTAEIYGTKNGQERRQSFSMKRIR